MTTTACTPPRWRSTTLERERARTWGRRTARRARRLAGWLAATDRHDERGSLSVWLIASVVALIGIAGIGTDLSGQVHSKQHAQDVAAQAARVGANQVSGDAVAGNTASVNFATARYAAQQYVQSAGLRGSARIVNGTTIEVTTTERYTTTFLGILGINHLKVTGDATAQLIRTEGGVEQ